MTSTIHIYDEYENYTKKYQEEYGKKCVVFMQVGSFYEIYSIDDGLIDIKEVSDIMNIQTTKKNKTNDVISKSNCYMCGVPEKSITKYANILLESSYTVVIVSQVTPPPKPKREVTHVLSPGTKIDDVHGYENRFLMCLFFDEMREWNTQKYILNIGLSYIDITTGEIYCYESFAKHNDSEFSLDDVYRIITSVNPKEYILFGNLISVTEEYILRHLELSSDNQCLHIRFHDYNKEVLKIKFQTELLHKVFPNHGMLSPIEFLDIERLPFATVSLCSLLQFVFVHNEKVLESISIPKIIQNEQNLILCYNTVRQLNILPNEFSNISLLDILNNCKTAIGKRYFKERLLRPLTDVVKLEKEYDLIEKLTKNKLYMEIRTYLTEIYDVERLFRRICMGTLSPMDFINIEHSIVHLKKISSIFPELEEMLDLDSFLQSFNVDLDMTKVHKFYIKDISENIFQKNIYPELDRLQNELDNHLKFFDDIVCFLNNDYFEGETFFKLEQNERDGILLSITKKRYATFLERDGASSEFTFKSLEGNKIIIKGHEFKAKPLSSSSTIVKISHPLFVKLNEQIDNLRDILRKQTTKNYINFLERLSISQISNMNKIVSVIGRFDYYTTNTYNSIAYHYSRPCIEAKENGDYVSFLKATALRHPIIERIQDTIPYISNDIELNGSGILLYGINAAGKSSLMKSIGLCLIMASAGMYVPADAFIYSPFKYIFTRIPTGDSIAKGQSTFTNEIAELRNIIRRADKNSLVIGDELCSGTESISAMSIISAGIMTLAERKSSFIFASHLHDIVHIPEICDLQNISVFHLSVDFNETTGKLVYDRLLKRGQGRTLYGLEVCKALNLPDEFMNIANKIRHNLLDIETNIISTNKSRYNSNLYKDNCAICGKKGKEVHHILEQQYADENGYIGKTSKNALYNLVNVCDRCHDKIHANEIKIEGYKLTSQGRELIFEKTI